MSKSLKYLLPIPSGILLGIFLPLEIYETLSNIFIRLSYFALVPFLIFSIPLGIENIFENRNLRKSFSKVFYYGILINIIGMITAVIAVLIYIPQRIPTLDRTIENTSVFNKTELLNTFFPKNIFQVFISNKPNLLSIYLISIIIGVSFYYVKQKGRTAREFMLSASNLFYHINTFIIKILNFGVIFIMANYVSNLVNFKDYQYYISNILFFVMWTVLIIFLILPIIIYQTTKSFNLAYKGIIISFQNIIFAGITKDAYAPYTILIEDIKNDRVNVKKSIITNLPIINFISKFGTIFVSIIAFFIILKSYSSLPVSIYEIIYISVLAFLFVFAFPHVPNSLIYIITMLSSTYTKGIELSYSNITPIMPILISSALMIDFAFNIAIISIINFKNEAEDKDSQI